MSERISDEDVKELREMLAVFSLEVRMRYIDATEMYFSD